MAPTSYYSYKENPFLKKEVEKCHTSAKQSYNYQLRKRKQLVADGSEPASHVSDFDRAAFTRNCLREKLRASSIVQEEAEKFHARHTNAKSRRKTYWKKKKESNPEGPSPDISPVKPKTDFIDDFIESIINETMDHDNTSGGKRRKVLAAGKF